MLIDTMGIDDKEQEQDQREGSVFSRFFGRLFGGPARRRKDEWDDEVADGLERGVPHVTTDAARKQRNPPKVQARTPRTSAQSRPQSESARTSRRDGGSSLRMPPPHADVPTGRELELEEALAARDKEIKRLRRLLAFYESLVEELPTPIFAKTAKARFCLFNKAYEQYFGVHRESLLGLNVLDVAHLSESDRRRYQEEDLLTLSEGSPRHYETEYDTPQGRKQAIYWTKSIGDRALGTWALVGMIVDITEQKAKVEELKKAQQQLRHLSRSDALTGLANRRPFAEYLSLGMDLTRRKGIPLCMLMADIDHFKHINDTYGHDNGDMVLRAIAGMLRSSCRIKDLAARIGGEEFVILLAATRLDEARLVAERIRANIGNTPLLPDGGYVTVSIGVASFRANETAKNFMKRVDAAMYAAKEAGRNRVMVAPEPPTPVAPR